MNKYYIVGTIVTGVMGIASLMARTWITNRTNARTQADAERKALLQAVGEAQNALRAILTNHIAHLSSAQESFTKFQLDCVKVQADLVTAVNQVGSECKEIHSELTKGLLDMEKQHGEIKIQIAGIK